MVENELKIYGVSPVDKKKTERYEFCKNCFYIKKNVINQLKQTGNVRRCSKVQTLKLIVYLN